MYQVGLTEHPLIRQNESICTRCPREILLLLTVYKQIHAHSRNLHNVTLLFKQHNNNKKNEMDERIKYKQTSRENKKKLKKNKK